MPLYICINRNSKWIPSVSSSLDIISKKTLYHEKFKKSSPVDWPFRCRSEVKTLGSGTKVARFSLATSDYYTNKDGEKVNETQWHKIIAWNGSATYSEKYLKKGMEVIVSGKLVYGNYDDKDGIKRYTTEIVSHDMLILTKKGE